MRTKEASIELASIRRIKGGSKKTVNDLMDILYQEMKCEITSCDFYKRIVISVK